ncbi:hypothetical protein BDQ17DRAFT_1352750 [Cyathus striatus]|nr:hypothetical protein BDQ17DRAFT_1352750 [Cyathus striatus]
MPHRLTSVRRYKISDDVLLAILHYLDPVSLYRTCKLYHRIYVLVMEFQSLYYKYELARAGMKDGPASHTDTSPRIRLHLLTAYRKDWPKLLWAHENRLQISSPSPVRMSGGFISYAGNQVIDLKEMPSSRIGRSPAQTRHYRYQITPNLPMECIAVDPLQSLVVTSEVFNINGGVACIRIGVRRLETFGQHPWSSTVFYDFNTQTSDIITEVNASVCGSKMNISVRFATGGCKHLLMDWRTFHVVCLDDSDVHFLSEPPLNDSSVPPTAFFFSDPATRVLQLIAKPSEPQRTRSPINNWLFINESYFRPPSRRDQRTTIPWSSWEQYCLIRDVSASKYIGIPRLVGNRVLYTETDPSSRPRDGIRTRLHLIDFVPYRDTFDSTHSWSHRGQRSPLIPNESFREIPLSTTSGLVVEEMNATEDNIVLQLAAHHGGRSAVVLTFDAPSVKSSRHH